MGHGPVGRSGQGQGLDAGGRDDERLLEDLCSALSQPAMDDLCESARDGDVEHALSIVREEPGFTEEEAARVVELVRDEAAKRFAPSGLPLLVDLAGLVNLGLIEGLGDLEALKGALAPVGDYGGKILWNRGSVEEWSKARRRSPEARGRR